MVRREVLLIVGLLFLQGCAATALTAGGLAASTGINHTLSGIVYKTFVTPVGELRQATLETLVLMEIEVTQDVETAAGWEIGATASDRRIEIELESLTPRTTRMRVIAHMGKVFLKDSATATEIIIQTIETLDRQGAVSEQAG